MATKGRELVGPDRHGDWPPRRAVVTVHGIGVNFCRFAEVADFETLVIGMELPPVEARRFEALGPSVIRA
ncbi:hypothetical protein [Nocardia abscessus]|uniref:hypothetical protein n=1 Tax=Nocardia abscessus TaxID=120957 RepID=UPI0005BB5A54|nr:hypothetical protein [Nocardia abscessus]MCC3332206.1 hypothetical protein [Nocardia abscessus]